MQKVYSSVIQFRGSHYDFGYMQGELLRNSFILPNRKKQWFSKKSYQFLIDLDEYYEKIQQYAPRIWQELKGLADSLNKSLEKTVQMFGGYYLEYKPSGCSIFTGNDYFIRNYDHDPLSYEGLYTVYQPSDKGYATIGPTMQITGRTDGINEKGLVIGYNFINRKQSKNGFICNMISRIILETCANVNEAIDLLKEIPHRHSFSYVLLDQSNRSVVVEASPRAVKVYESNVCTNHFSILTEENRYRMEDSIQREEAIKKQKYTVTNSLTAFKMMNESHKGVFSTNYGSWSGTIHTSIYYPHTLQAGIALGGDRPPFLFDFHKWLKGEDFFVKQINGKLNTQIPFVNMVKL